MDSGQWITYFLIVSVLVVFPVWEFVQLYRRREGNKSARTMSQYVTKRAEEGHVGWRIFRLAFPILIALAGLWLIFHWEGLCGEWGWVCGLSERV